MSYDELWLGTGNSMHPANEEDQEEQLPGNFTEALQYYDNTKDDSFLLAEIDNLRDNLDVLHNEIVDLIHFCRNSDNAFMANKLCAIRDKINTLI